MFAVLTAALLGMVVSLLYFGNRDLALRTAQEEMIKARAWSVQSLLTIISDTEQAVNLVADFAGRYPDEAQTISGLDFFHALTRRHHYHYSIYLGLEDDGGFFQNVVLSDAMNVFGPAATAIPETATRVLRVIDTVDGTKKESYFWSGEENVVEPFFEGSATYDPRKRPWYLGALESDRLYVTVPYIFESTGQPGVTFAKRITDASGRTLGAVGIDITMSAISRILEDLRIGEEGLVFMLDRQARLMSYTGTRASGQGASYVTSDAVEGLENQSEVVERAILKWQNEKEPFFRFASPENDQIYVAYVDAIPDVFGTEPTLGLIVPEDEFVGAINRSTARTLKIGAFAMAFAILFIIVAARLLSHSLKIVAAEARRISTFDLEHDLKLRTVFQEIFDLETAVSSMKAGLAGFGAYVPKDLVRSIVASAEKPEIGGTSRDITLLFSDLQGFTARTENLEPEELMPALSHYFEIMETAISDNFGIVDKYIGDAIMALWNAPLDDPRHVEHACRAALACLVSEEDLNNDPAMWALVPSKTRFGLHTGHVIVGNVGSLSRMQYTALGSAVNLASRLEGLNKYYGTSILASEDVVRKVSHIFLFREIDVISPAGAKKPTAIFELVGEIDAHGKYPATTEQRLEIGDWKNCYDLFRRRDWDMALKAFVKHQNTFENRTLVRMYIQRCHEFITNPPPDDWDGVHRFSEK